ncbi:MAG: PIG-L family deacetylase [Tepidisphaeraceae bacterium]
MPDPAQITRLDAGRRTQFKSLASALSAPSLARETWLFVSPHDDDLCLSCGLLMQQAVAEGVNVQVLVVTDGRMGYCTLEQRDTIAEIRRTETYESFALLGVGKDHIEYVGYPDGGLNPLCGRRKAQPGDEVNAIAGYVGLQNAFTYHLRRTRATRVFVPTSADLHPDHQVTHNELMICLFHAAGTIWPELGEPLADVPKVYELAVYCDFPAPPQLQIQSGGDAFEKKLASIAAYRSQTQIARLVESIRKAGPIEYVREMNFRFYSPDNYKPMFA